MNSTNVTFSIAAYCPYPFWPGIPPRGIVLLSDTRYSFRDARGRETRPPFDFGMKLAQLGSHAGCVCAGNVQSAQLAMAEFAKAFTAVPRPIDGTIVEELVRAYARAVSTARSAGLYGDFAVAIGYIAADDRPMLIGLGPESQMIDQPEWGLLIGQRPHQSRYVAALEERIRLKVTAPSFTFDVNEWILPYVVPLQAALIDAAIDDTVGGGLQLATLDETGFGYRDVFIADRPESDSLEWTRATRDVTFDWTAIPPNAMFPLDVISAPVLPSEVDA